MAPTRKIVEYLRSDKILASIYLEGVIFTVLIQKCKSCSNRFRWETIVKSICWGYKSIECVNCKTKHYIKSIYRIIIAILIVLPLFFQQFLSSLFLSLTSSSYLFWIIGANLLWGFMVVCISPFFARYDVRK